MRKIDEGDRFGEWTADETVITGRGVRCRCVCSCGTVKDVLACELLRGSSLKCQAHLRRVSLRAGDHYGCYTVISFSHTKGKHCFYNCRCCCGAEKAVRGSTLTSRNPKFCRECVKRNPLIGARYGKWTVLGFDCVVGYKSKWKVKCDCGTADSVLMSNLLSGKSEKCVLCRNAKLKLKRGRRRASQFGDVFSVEGMPCLNVSMPLNFWNKLLSGALSRRIRVILTPEEAISVFKAQNGKCIFTGCPLVLEDSKSRTASIDRIESNGDYCVDNIQWVHKHINVAKSVFSPRYFRSLCRAVTGTTL